MYEIEVKHVNNPDKFREAAIHFEKHEYYTAAPKGTTDYRKFWDEELKRCIHGYIADDGDYITGYFYFYLNYSRIIKVRDQVVIDAKGRERKRAVRIEGFPDFHDYDWAYFNAIEEAETSGKHMVVLKKRGAGYSFKGGSMLCRNFFCIPDSKSYAIASEMEFLTKDGLLTKAWDMMGFIDKHTALAKRRQKIDRATHKKASFVYEDPDSNVKIEDGYGSEIIGVSLKNDPQKARGKRGKLILWEEAGVFPNLKQSWQVARPSVEADSIAFGLMIAYGTGGTEGANYEGLRDLFYEPEAYNVLPIRNVWDEGNIEKPCGFFVPQYYNMYGINSDGIPFMDANGNSNIKISIKHELKQREKVATASDHHSLDLYVAERPFTPEEATLQLSGNIFPKKDLIRQLSEIRNSKTLSGFKQVGELYWTSKGEVKWQPKDDNRDIIKYRLGKHDDKTGAIVIWEHPVENAPHGLYIMGVDPYDHDSSNTSSLGSCFVYKRFQNFEGYYDILVAEYTGRPETANDFYEQVRLLAKYYRATVLYENEKKGLYSYFSQKHCEHLLADQPDIIRDILKDSTVIRGKGIHMTKEIKGWGERLIRDWLNEEYAPGRKNLTKIFSEPLLEELIAFNPEGNFDRVMALMMVMIYKEQLYNIQVKKKTTNSRKKLFEEPLFATNNFNLF